MHRHALPVTPVPLSSSTMFLFEMNQGPMSQLAPAFLLNDVFPFLLKDVLFLCNEYIVFIVTNQRPMSQMYMQPVGLSPPRGSAFMIKKASSSSSS